MKKTRFKMAKSYACSDSFLNSIYFARSMADENASQAILGCNVAVLNENYRNGEPEIVPLESWSAIPRIEIAVEF